MPASGRYRSRFCIVNQLNSLPFYKLGYYPAMAHFGEVHLRML